ncbi:hypothetical protein B0T11DRAFT_7246 [Plectosphaerella cucumerina]|uniref:Uncharacterized protein n=1 Tax=Plectosphaerella cucumerina TaxID=40658 RepID=A0A8K0X7V9_9PEZI|nr:hypothetical protein B0T11DRAFT_7246 [Plectosphaerella cucumerina]
MARRGRKHEAQHPVCPSALKSPQSGSLPSQGPARSCLSPFRRAEKKEMPYPRNIGAAAVPLSKAIPRPSPVQVCKAAAALSSQVCPSEGELASLCDAPSPLRTEEASCRALDGEHNQSSTMPRGERTEGTTGAAQEVKDSSCRPRSPPRIEAPPPVLRTAKEATSLSGVLIRWGGKDGTRGLDWPCCRPSRAMPWSGAAHWRVRWMARHRAEATRSTSPDPTRGSPGWRREGGLSFLSLQRMRGPQVQTDQTGQTSRR